VDNQRLEIHPQINFLFLKKQSYIFSLFLSLPLPSFPSPVGRPSVLGMVNGAVAGLVCITPACGFVNLTGAFFIGSIGGVACFFGSQLKKVLLFDDALDAFGVHAVGGAVGGILTAFFANKNYGGYDGVFYAGMQEGGHLLAKQIYAIVVTAAWSAVVSFILLKGLDLTVGLRVKPTTELLGLDPSYFWETIEVWQLQGDWKDKRNIVVGEEVKGLEDIHLRENELVSNHA
jgi:hypothetical protein